MIADRLRKYRKSKDKIGMNRWAVEYDYVNYLGVKRCFEILAIVEREIAKFNRAYVRIEK